MGYVLGVSSGAFGVTGAEEKAQLAGLFRKAQSSITKGVSFVQLDLESVSEFEEPDLPRRMEEEIIKKLGITFGIHSETRAFGVEAAELDSAIRMEYERSHRRIVDILKYSKKIKSKFVLIHSSESEPFPLLERTMQSSDLMDVDGGLLSEFLEKEENKELLEWVFGGKNADIVACVFNLWLSKPPEQRKQILLTPKDIENALREKNITPKNFIWMEIFGGSTLSELLRRTIEDIVANYEINLHRKYEEFTPEEREKIVDDGIRRRLENYLNDTSKNITSFTQSKSLHYGPERLAYYLMAKWMEKTGDPLWKKIVDASIGFFTKKDKETVEVWMQKNRLDPQNLKIDNDNFRTMYQLWVPAVSARYIYGHFFPKRVEYKDPKEYLDGMIFVFESPMGGRGIEEWLRLGNPYLYYFLVEEANQKAGKEIFAVAMDFEHMLSLRIDPGLVIELLPLDGGKRVRVIHAGWPSTLAPAHLPIEIGSTQQRYLYEMYYKLKQKGFGKDDKDYYIVFERGGPETFQQSVVSLKIIVDFLGKDVSPEELKAHPDKYKEFWGIDVSQMASIDRQRVNIREHAFDPLKGLVAVPEEEHGFLGRAAVEKGKTEEWRKERYR